MMLYTPSNIDDRADLLRWAEMRLPMATPFDRDKSLPIAVVRSDEIAAVVVFSQWRSGNVEVTVAADTPRWATRDVITDLLAWPFEALNVRRITAMVSADNARSRKLAEGLVFHLEGYHPEWFANGDALSYGLTRSAWRASRWYLPRGMMQEAA